MIAVSASAAKPAGRPNAPAKANAPSSFSDLLAASDPAAEPRKNDTQSERVTPDGDKRPTPPQDAKTTAKRDHSPAGTKEDKPEADDTAGAPPEALASIEVSAAVQMAPLPAPAPTAASQIAAPSPADGTATISASDPVKIGGTQSAHATTAASLALGKESVPPASVRAPSSTPATTDLPRAREVMAALPQDNAPDSAKTSRDAPAATSVQTAAAAPSLARQAVPAALAASRPAGPVAVKTADDAPAAQAAKDTSDNLSMAVKIAAAGTQPLSDAPKTGITSTASAKKAAPASEVPVAPGPLGSATPAAPDAKAGVKDSAAPQLALDKTSDNAKAVHAATPDKVSQPPEPQAPPMPPATPAPPPALAQNLLASGLTVPATASAAAPVAMLHIATARDDAAPDLDALAVSVAARAMSGVKQFEIRLDPPELGRVDVRLSIDASGKTEAHMTADQPQTLTLLQKDAPALTQALRDAGLDVSQGGLNFSLRGQDRQGGESGQGAPGRRTNLSVSRVIGAVQAQAAISAGGAAADARLDIHV